MLLVHYWKHILKDVAWKWRQKCSPGIKWKTPCKHPNILYNGRLFLLRFPFNLILVWFAFFSLSVCSSLTLIIQKSKDTHLVKSTKFLVEVLKITLNIDFFCSNSMQWNLTFMCFKSVSLFVWMCLTISRVVDSVHSFFPNIHYTHGRILGYFYLYLFRNQKYSYLSKIYKFDLQK